MVFLCLILVLNTSCNKKESRKKTPKELKAELKLQEKANSLTYVSLIKATITPQKKIVRKGSLFKKAKYEDDGAIINGIIENKASFAKYKDVKLKVAYYSNTKSIISEKYFVLYEYYYPNSTETFSIKVYPPKAYKTFNVEVIKAIGE